MKLFVRPFVVALLLALFAGISFGQKAKTVKIGVSIDSLKIERWQTDLAAFQERAEQLGAEVLVKSADGDDELQVKQVDELLASGIDVLVLIPHNCDKVISAVEAAHARKVAVISYDRLVRNAPIDLFVGFDAFSVGLLQAQALVTHAPKGNYILLGGSPSDDNSHVVRNGQMKVLDPYIKSGDIHVVADLWVPDWSPTQAYMLVREQLEKSSGPLTAILASNDGTAGGAIEALRDKELAGKVLVSGQDADLAAIVRLFEGTQLMTVYKPLNQEARMAAEAAVQMATGQTVNTDAAISNGKGTVKAILLMPVGIDRQNVKSTVLKDGFQRVEMVKQGLPKELWSELNP